MKESMVKASKIFSRRVASTAIRQWFFSRKFSFAGKRKRRGLYPLFDNRYRFFNTSVSPADFKPPHLPLLTEMARAVRASGFAGLENFAVIGVQHMLPSTATLFDVMIDELKLKPENMYFSGKFYSGVPAVENYIRRRGIHLAHTRVPRKPHHYEDDVSNTMRNMWESFEDNLKAKGIENIIILDEGAHCIDNMPIHIRYKYSIASIEQTRYGFYSKMSVAQPFPRIDVASSVAKKKLESPLIAEAVLKRVEKILPMLSVHRETIFGVIGNGAVGSAITKYLLSKGYKVVIYDKSESSFHGIYDHNCYRVENITSLLTGAHIVFGCTGQDVTKNIDMLDLVNHNVTLVSCSSQNIEFYTLLEQISRQGTSQTSSGNLSQLKYITNTDQEITILENGFPINFDRTPECDPINDMVLTRGLLLGAVIQAAREARKLIDDGKTLNKYSHCMLDPYIQKFVVDRWQYNQPQSRYAIELLSDCFNNIKWIKGNSSGNYEEDKLFFSLDKPLLLESQNPTIRK